MTESTFPTLLLSLEIFSNWPKDSKHSKFDVHDFWLNKINGWLIIFKFFSPAVSSWIHILRWISDLQHPLSSQLDFPRWIISACALGSIAELIFENAPIKQSFRAPPVLTRKLASKPYYIILLCYSSFTSLKFIIIIKTFILTRNCTSTVAN